MNNEDANVMVLLYHRPEWGSGHGRIGAGNRLVAVDVSPVRGSPKLRLSTLLADRVLADPGTFQSLLDLTTAAHSPAGVRFDEEDHCIRAEVHVPSTRPRGLVPDEASLEFEDFAALLSDERLQLALELCQGRILGTPVDLFDGPDSLQDNL